MKKIIIIMTVLLCSVNLTIVHAEELGTENFYSSYYNTYYNRSQHTYAFKMKNGEVHHDFAPALYILYRDKEQALSEEEWNLEDVYNLPYDATNDDYFIVFCSDLDPYFYEGDEYTRVNLNESDFSDDVKGHIAGILKNSYPYISFEQMVKNLVDAKVLVEKTNDEGESGYTAPDNESPLHFITIDELIAASSMAIYHFTNPGQITDMYFRTLTFSNYYSVVNRDEVYERGTYSEVENDIQAIYDYLITLESSSNERVIKNAEYEEGNDGEYYIRLTLHEDVTKDDDLNIILKEGENTYKYPVKELLKDSEGVYFLKTTDIENIDDVEITLSGKAAMNETIYVYVPVAGKEASQTLVGLSSTTQKIDYNYVGGILSNFQLMERYNQLKAMHDDSANPDTIDSIENKFGTFSVALFCLGFSVLGIGAVSIRKRIR